MQVRPLSAEFVAEVDGIDLRHPVSEAAHAAIVEAIDRYAVLVFRDQPLDDEQQIAFSSLFGPLETTRRADRPGVTLRLNPHVSDVSNLDERNRILPTDDFRRISGLANQLWHTDSSYKRVPARYALLSAHAVPPAGGETEFADMRAAYDALPETRKAEIEDRVAEHSIFTSRAKIGFTDFTPEERAKLPPVPHVMVRTHPGSSRRSIYVASHADTVRGMPLPEARLLLMELIEHATQPRFVHRHIWRVGDLVMWDNRCTMHRGRPYDLTQIRDMHRTTVSDEVPTVAETAA